MQIKEIFNFLKKIIYPARIKCIFCGAELDTNDKHLTCEKCLKSLPFNAGKVCTRCGQPINDASQYCIDCKGMPCDYEYARAPFLYEDKIKDCIHKFKFNDAQYLSYALSAYLADEYILQGFKCDACVPVPLYAKRLSERGYNQAFLLARDFYAFTGVPVLENALIKTKATASQTTLSGKERQENLSGVFSVPNKALVKGKRILIIDDIYTSGATVKECAAALKKAGANSVFVLTVAHTVKHIVFDAPPTLKP